MSTESTQPTSPEVFLNVHNLSAPEQAPTVQLPFNTKEEQAERLKKLQEVIHFTLYKSNAYNEILAAANLYGTKKVQLQIIVDFGKPNEPTPLQTTAETEQPA